jgi:hypothetical protein
MINFVNVLPVGENLEPSSIYYVQDGEGNAKHYVTDNLGIATPVSSEELVQEYIAKLKGQAEGYAELDENSNIPIAQIPSGSRPAEISSAISSAQTALQSNINQKADADAVYSKTEVDSSLSTLQGAVDAKQSNLLNASDLAKIGDSTFDGKQIVLIGANEW